MTDGERAESRRDDCLTTSAADGQSPAATNGPPLANDNQRDSSADEATNEQQSPPAPPADSPAADSEQSGQREIEPAAVQPESTLSAATSSQRQPAPQVQHPLLEELNKDVYNVLAELHALIDGNAWSEAAKLVTALDLPALEGVAPHPDDPDLIVSLPTAVQLAMQDHAELRSTMKAQFEELARLRIRQAITSMDVEAIQAVALQFQANTAASEAHRWLGDRALSAGSFQRALTLYRRAEALYRPAEATGPTSSQSNLQARIRLASAMMGHDVPPRLSETVQLAGRATPADEFESIITDMLNRQTGRAEQSQQDSTLPTQIEGQLRGEFARSSLAFQHVATAANEPDWIARTSCMIVDDGVLIVSDWSQLATFDVITGAEHWRYEPASGDEIALSLIDYGPPRPLVRARRIYARLQQGKVAVLTCCNRQTGQLVWSTDPDDERLVVSDPLMVAGRLIALTLTRTDQDQNLLSITEFSEESGTVTRQLDLVRLNSSWWTCRHCSAIAEGDLILVALGGAVLCCDKNGQLRWIRRQNVVAVDPQTTPFAEYYDIPHLGDGVVYVAQPRVRSVDCLEIDTGRLRTTRPLPGPSQIVGVTNEQLVVQSGRVLLGLRCHDFHVNWRHELPDARLSATLCDDKSRVVLAEAATGSGAKQALRFAWYDLATGRRQAELVAPAIEFEKLRIGPLATVNQRLWALLGDAADPDQRLYEFRPTSPPPTR